MGRVVQIAGGHRDGQTVPYVGPTMLEPVSKPVEIKAFYAELDPNIIFEVRAYDLYQWANKSGSSKGWRYVLRDIAKDLGVPQ